MADITINVSRIDGTNNLSLRQGDSRPGSVGDPGDDSLQTGVSANQTIEWRLDPEPDAGRSTDITLIHVEKKGDTNSQSLLTSDIITAVDGVITATVVATAPVPGQNTESYKIGYSLNSNPQQTEIWDDPQLKMN